MSSVSDSNCYEESLAWNWFKNSFWFLNKNSSLLLMTTASIAISECPWILSASFSNLFHVKVDSHLFQETINHILEVATSSESMSHTASSSSEAVSLLLGLLIFVYKCNHNGWCPTGFFYFQERMIVVKFLFTVGTIVKVLADSTLVTNTNNRTLTASITLDSFMYDNFSWNTFFRLFSLAELHVDVLFAEKFIEDKSGLFLEFLLHESLQSFARNTSFFSSLVGTLTFLLFDWFRLHGLCLNFCFFDDGLNRLLNLLNNLKLWFNNSNLDRLVYRLNFDSGLFFFLLLLFSFLGSFFGCFLFFFFCSFFLLIFLDFHFFSNYGLENQRFGLEDDRLLLDNRLGLYLN